MATKNQGDVQDFVLAKLGGKFLRFATVDSVPEGAEEAITMASLNEMTKEKIGELYGAVAGVNSKTFKDKKIAVDSLTYQVGKMSFFDPNSPPAPKSAATTRKEVKSAEKTARKNSEVYELLSPPDLEKVLRDIAPQARELILIMTELAKEKGSASFSGADLNARLKQPETSVRLRTKQDPMRILAYYKGGLIGKGLIRTN